MLNYKTPKHYRNTKLEFEFEFEFELKIALI
jgi:hypothetical protein